MYLLYLISYILWLWWVLLFLFQSSRLYCTHDFLTDASPLDRRDRNADIVAVKFGTALKLIDRFNRFDVTIHGYAQRRCLNMNWLHTIRGFLPFSWHNWRYNQSVCFKLISDQTGFVVIWYLRFKLTIINWVISVIYDICAFSNK